MLMAVASPEQKTKYMEPYADIEDEGDPFGAFDDEPSANADAAPAETQAASDGKKKGGGLFGAAFRALSKSAVPKGAASNLMKQLPVPNGPPGAPPAREMATEDGGEDPFGFGDDSDDAAMEDEEDPFGFGDDDETSNPFEDDPS